MVRLQKEINTWNRKKSGNCERGRVMQRSTCGKDGGTGVFGHCSGGQRWWLGFRLSFQERNPIMMKMVAEIPRVSAMFRQKD
ncbi:hypothetical protein Hanom_Chr02g00157291 [Helianthus anomalus]